MTIFLSLVIGYLVGVVAADHTWRRHFDQAIRNINANFNASQGRKPA